MADPDPNGRRTRFDPTRHGFHLDNNDEWPGHMLIDIPLIGRVDIGHTSYGLCGGMSYAALDTFHYDGRTPNDTEIPPHGSPLRSYIYNRQQSSFGADNAFMIRRFIEWTPLTIKTQLGIDGLHVRSDRQFKRRIAPAIDKGEPIALGILRAQGSDVVQLGKKNAVLINHQVVAIGYRLCRKTAAMKKHWAIEIYDPNGPDQVCTLHYSDQGRSFSVHFDTDGSERPSPDDPSQNVTGGKVRAFFVIPYTRKHPYWVP